ncbi:TIR domain-containing protein [Pseudoduganella sp. GCM10020061]|uniref:TIR domain-containing protein n=1 Tax=Pseudoduganella sp. GCM10020061 TaxID=3317345 RepID=UPI0036259F71
MIHPKLLRDIENTVSDLRSSDFNSFSRYIKKLSRLLHDQQLEDLTSQLAEMVDLDAWIAAGEATAGSMVGSAQLEWPMDTEAELGLAIKLVDRFAEQPSWAVDFSFTFCYAGGSISSNLQKMVEQILVPFVRDYINFLTAATGTQEVAQINSRPDLPTRKIFVVHGHDHSILDSVARFLEKIEFEPIVLHEQANLGRTVIEKIEAHSDVGFAVVLLTPDDVGSVLGGQQRSRVRQNVMLELGYFIGRLGRSHVCALKRGELELPSDFGGVLYEDFDSGGVWKGALARELQAAGFEIDWNLVLRGK